MSPLSTRQQRIIEAALPFICLSPTATVQEIAHAAGTSKATFHRHFDSRDALFTAMIEHALHTLRTSLLSLPVQLPPEDLLRAILRAYIAQGDKVYFLFYYPNNKAPTDFTAQIEAALAPYYTALGTLFAQGYFNPRLPLSWLTTSLHTHITIAWVQTHLNHLTLDEAVELVWTHFFEGAQGRA